MIEKIKAGLTKYWLHLVIIGVFMFVIYSVADIKTVKEEPIIVVNEGKKIDLSLDRGFLSCIQLQRRCIFDNLELKTNHDKIIENCKGMNYCDQKYSASR